MANQIAKFKKYVDMLDEVYQTESLTSVLDGDATLTDMGKNANEIVIPVMEMDGLADYSRNGGYIRGSAKITYQTKTFNYDRGRRFDIDAMDNEETAGLSFGKLSSEFIRTMVVPEMDAFRFATYAGMEGINKVQKNLETADEWRDAISIANTHMNNKHVTKNRILFITPLGQSELDDMDTYKSKKILEKFSRIIEVPSDRFFTGIDLLDGESDNELMGGFKKAAGAFDINFMIVEPSALLQYPKHIVNKAISPEDNQTSDAWMFFYRAYGLVEAYDNKKDGIYVHYANA